MNAKTCWRRRLSCRFRGSGSGRRVLRGAWPDRHCTVTTTRPTEQTTVTQIGPLAFESREKAEDRIKTTKICTDDATTGTSVHIDKN